MNRKELLEARKKDEATKHEHKLVMVIPVLDSHEALRRQILYWSNTVLGPNPELRKNCKILIADDMSDPPLAKLVWDMKEQIHFSIEVFRTEDERPWTQQLGQNMGVGRADSEYCMMTAIDHIMPPEVFRAGVEFTGDKMHFPRQMAVLDENGEFTRDHEVLREYGAVPGQEDKFFGAQDVYIIKRWIYRYIGGYSPEHFGHYFGDTKFHRAYGDLHYESEGLVRRHEVGPCIYVFPEPAKDVKSLFHKLPRRGWELKDVTRKIEMGEAKKGGYVP